MLQCVAPRRILGYPIVQLRQFGYENNFVCMIPFNVIVRNADDLFCGKPQMQQEDSLAQHMSYAASLLLAYAQCLGHLRRKAGIDLTRYPYGM